MLFSLCMAVTLCFSKHSAITIPCSISYCSICQFSFNFYLLFFDICLPVVLLFLCHCCISLSLTLTFLVQTFPRFHHLCNFLLLYLILLSLLHYSCCPLNWPRNPVPSSSMDKGNRLLNSSLCSVNQSLTLTIAINRGRGFWVKLTYSAYSLLV